ncbi:uncharacterized protein MELLADRAFT_86403 [Melampsora larici-populina 98AG31]|uniref:Uncharacterized protein n=1 Tax=Melampsora larici-populina (strain 98AG31 / pathotype 3-4-7) TaxID=747676 RepID=F4RLN7_MELLP|nr:uncharacterized protein MELLADRAFT_86403 [Melampsora larici-populina 98AG31]EGG06566.1 hypothetical protein MELLADRAFT_86403 [Melampsora larici-populina 98AG31]
MLSIIKPPVQLIISISALEVDNYSIPDRSSLSPSAYYHLQTVLFTGFIVILLFIPDPALF